MGLDIAYYGDPKFISSGDDLTDEQYDEFLNKYVHVTNDELFMGRLGSLKEGWYEAKKLGHFRAGSYSGYNSDRNAMSMQAIGVSTLAVLTDPDRYDDKPMFELVCFSDCEGVLGPEVCAKLAKDMEITNLKGRFPLWYEAFKAAADNKGFVHFH